MGGDIELHGVTEINHRLGELNKFLKIFAIDETLISALPSGTALLVPGRLASTRADARFSE